MKTETKAPRLEAQDEAIARAAHRSRVAATAIQVMKRLGWTGDRQQTVRESVNEHDHRAFAAEDLVKSLASGLCGLPPSQREPQSAAAGEACRLLEMCCFFAQRWEFAPYETAGFNEIVNELRAIVQEGFFVAGHVEALASVPSVSLAQIREVVAKLPVFPAVAQRAMLLVSNPNAGAAQSKDLIGADPVLAGEVLRAANSPLYSPAIPIRSIPQAVVHMGLAECCRIVSAAAMRPLFDSPLVKPLWNHSLEVAKLSEALARTTGRTDPEEAFLAGLMHDVGRLALWKLPGKPMADYAAMLDAGCEPMFAETLLASFDHSTAGREVMLRWRLPDHMVQAVELHHQPERCDSMLAQVLYLAEHCSASQEDVPSMARYKEAMDRAGLDQQQLAALSESRSLFAD